MADNQDIMMDDMMDDEIEIVRLMGENGQEMEFEFLDLIEYEGDDYVVLFPMEDGDDEVVILKVEDVEDEPDMEAYVGVQDEKILEAVFEIFKDRNQDMFDFED